MAAPAHSRRPSLLARAAVLVSFDLDDLVGGEDDTDAVIDLLNVDCDLVRNAAGDEAWSLKDQRRRAVLASSALEELVAARGMVHTQEGGLLQTALDRSLEHGWTPGDLGRLSAEDARALTVVAGWWQDRHPLVPDVATTNLLSERLNLFANFRAMAGDHFIGRTEILQQLREAFLRRDDPVFAVHGVGGIGKSAVIARHVVWALDEAGSDVAVLDFDDATLNPFFVLDLVSRIITLVARQSEGPVRPRVERLARVALDAAETAAYRDQTSSRSAIGSSWKEVFELVGDLSAFTGRPLLVVFDTVEQVQRRGSSAVAAFATLVQQLTEAGSQVRVVLAGRAPVPQLDSHDHELSGLGPGEATTLLTRLCTRRLQPKTARTVVEALGTSPLTIRLAARLLSEPDEEVGDIVALDLHASRIDAELYRRVLDHIRDPAVRKLAHPGLVLRRITPEIIEQVLAEPCGVEVADTSTAQQLFERMALEAMLVERLPREQALVHRSDVRRVMLPQLLADKRELAELIQARAIAHYAGRRDLASRTEELYHRLLTGQDRDTLDQRWDERAAEVLFASRDELPPASRVLLTEQLADTYLDDDDRALVGDAQWAREVEPQVRRLISSGSPAQAVHLLQERRDRHGQPLLPSLEIEALEALGEFTQATKLARRQRRAAAIANDVATVTTYSLHAARLLERRHQNRAADKVLHETLALVTQESIHRLRLLVAQLGTTRRRPGPGGPRRPDAETERRKEEVLRLVDALGERSIREVPGMQRDLAAEVGDRAPRLLEDALVTLGVDASAGGPIPAALADLDAEVARQQGRPGLVASLIGLESDADGDVDWDQITFRPRGETGKALLEVLGAFASAADPVRSAVARNYQQEADAALLGKKFLVSRKR